MKKLLPAFGLALVASLALSAFAAGSASALSYQPGSGKFPQTFTVNGGGFPIHVGSEVRTCKAATGGGKLISGTSGEMTLNLTGCELSPGNACTTTGQAKGTIAALPLSVKPVYLNAAKTEYGLQLSPTASPNWWEVGTFAEFTCLGLPVVWLGKPIVKVTKPGLNVSSTTFSLTLLRSGQIEGAGFVYPLSESFNGGPLKEVEASLQATLTTASEGKFIP